MRDGACLGEAHPRSRGENCSNRTRILPRQGSSPLTRGKRDTDVCFTPAARLIPAHAGKTLARPRRPYACRAHPRSRGENSLTGSQWGFNWGSSPLTRGKLRNGSIRVGRHRLIPAHAGKTVDRSPNVVLLEAHPRSRGENESTISIIIASLGSSPLTRGKRSSADPNAMTTTAHPRSRGENTAYYKVEFPKRGSSPLTRGKPSCTIHCARCIGLIPAHAGKTPTPEPTVDAPVAHPRSRGENMHQRARSDRGRGSSPLTRGKPRPSNGHHPRAGLIPAHAGKTCFPYPSRVSIRAHPRSRGENRFVSKSDNVQSGSSPLTRGKLPCGRLCCRYPGLIPAHAGKTSTFPTPDSLTRAHPRSRGENLDAIGELVYEAGSSPLTRGKPGFSVGAGLRLGLIPAHAGKTSHPRKTARPHPRSRGENALDARRLTWEGGSSPLTRGKLPAGRRDRVE